MASGLGRRFGGSKLLAELDGVPLLGRALAATDGLFERRIVVTRSAEAAAWCRERGVPVVLHSLPLRSDTIRLGLAAVGAQGPQPPQGCLFCPCDQPLLRRQTVAALREAFLREPGCIWRPAWQGQPGAPVLFPRWAFAELAALEGRGGGAVAAAHPDRVRTLPVADRWELFDVDTPADLAAARQAAALCAGPDRLR